MLLYPATHLRSQLMARYSQDTTEHGQIPSGLVAVGESLPPVCPVLVAIGPCTGKQPPCRPCHPHLLCHSHPDPPALEAPPTHHPSQFHLHFSSGQATMRAPNSGHGSPGALSFECTAPCQPLAASSPVPCPGFGSKGGSCPKGRAQLSAKSGQMIVLCQVALNST